MPEQSDLLGSTPHQLQTLASASCAGNRPTIESTYGPIEDWDVSSVTSFVALFQGLRNFNEEIGNWETSQVTDMSFTFSSATAFNKDIGSWKTPRVTTMSNMFANARAFNQDIGSWDTSQVTDMTNMFNGGRAFNGKVGSWDVSSVTPHAIHVQKTRRPSTNPLENGFHPRRPPASEFLGCIQ